MIQQLVQRLIDDTAGFEPGVSDPTTRKERAANAVLAADPLDLVLYMERVIRRKGRAAS